MDKTIMELVYQ